MNNKHTIRAPIFTDLYENEAEFHKNTEDGITSQLEHIKGVGVDSFENFSLENIRTARPYSFNSFNPRRLSDYICSAINTKVVSACAGRPEFVSPSSSCWRDQNQPHSLDTFFMGP